MRAGASRLLADMAEPELDRDAGWDPDPIREDVMRSGGLDGLEGDGSE